MRTFSCPPLVELGPRDNLTTPVFRNAAERPDDVVLLRRHGAEVVDVTAREFAAEVIATAKGLLAAGVAPGDRIGLLARTRYEWTLLDYAILTAGAVTVPVYETSAPDQVAWSLGDSGAVGVIVETDAHREALGAIADRLPGVRHVWQIDAGAVATLVEAGRDVLDEEVLARRAALTGQDLATIIYTSGTTGRPKGCRLTHHNLLFDAESALSEMQDVFVRSSTTLLFLPLAHSFARVIQIGCLSAGVRLGHTPDVNDLPADLERFQPSFLLSVPRVFEKIYNRARLKAHSAGTGSGKIFDLAESVAVRYSEALDRGRPNPVLAAQHVLFDKLVYGKIRARLGGQVSYVVSGGAPLGVRLSHFFRGVGLTVLEGYGLTETSAAATVNRPGAVRLGTVGRPMPGVTVGIADDGEVLIRGENVFAGYWDDEPATRAIVDDDGWLHSGDVGELDADGFLRITGRKKELIVTAGGKNVSPAVLEDVVRSHPLVSQCMVVGDRRPYVAALVTLDPEHLEHWLAEHGKAAATPISQLRDDPDLRAELDGAVAAANAAVSRAEGIRRYAVLDVDFTEEGGLLTPSLKLKRAIVAERFATQLEALYAQ